jgi:hypothetical protein
MIELKCNKRPQQSRYITEGDTYSGALMNQNGTLTNNFNEATHFVCENNAGKEARYKIELFDVIVPPEPVRLPKRTFDDVIALLSVNVNYDVDDDELNYDISFDNDSIITGMFKVRSNIELSCGIGQCGNLTNFINFIRDIKDDTFYDDTTELNISDDELLRIKRHIIREVFHNITDLSPEECEARFLMFSNDDYEKDLYWDILDEFSITNNNTNAGINPNSDREIKIWVLRLEDGE